MLKNETHNSVRDVLALVYETGELDQVSAGRKLGISKAASNVHFLKLARENLIEQGEVRNVSRGRPPVTWRICNGGSLFLGLVLEVSGLFAELVDFSGESHWHSSLDLAADVSQSRIAGALKTLVRQAQEFCAARGIRIRQTFFALPGNVTSDGVISNATNFPSLTNWNADGFLHELGLECAFTDCQASAMILSETRDLPDSATVAILNWDYGFGITFASAGQQILLPKVNAVRYRQIWDFGHLRVVPGGVKCRCGKYGCLEAYIGGRRLVEQANYAGISSLKEFIHSVQAGEPDTVRILCGAVEFLVQNLYPFLEFLGVDSILFTGPLARTFDCFKEALIRKMADYYSPEELRNFIIRAGRFGRNGLSYGAALNARQYYLYPDTTNCYRGLGQTL